MSLDEFGVWAPTDVYIDPDAKLTTAADVPSPSPITIFERQPDGSFEPDGIVDALGKPIEVDDEHPIYGLGYSWEFEMGTESQTRIDLFPKPGIALVHRVDDLGATFSVEILLQELRVERSIEGSTLSLISALTGNQTTVSLQAETTPS